jgi:hypothetical protein
MEVILQKLIGELNGAVFTLLAILFVAFFVVYKFGSIVSKFGIFEDKNKDLDKTVGGIKDTLSSIKATTDLLYQAHLSTVRSQSPISLTQKGIDISKELGLDQKIANHWASIKDMIGKHSPSNPYDIQVACMEIARKYFDSIFSDEEKNEIKLYAFKTGQNLLEIYPIIGVIIRDQYLKEKGISVDEVDRHVPSKSPARN